MIKKKENENYNGPMFIPWYNSNEEREKISYKDLLNGKTQKPLSISTVSCGLQLYTYKLHTIIHIYSFKRNTYGSRNEEKNSNHMFKLNEYSRFYVNIITLKLL